MPKQKVRGEGRSRWDSLHYRVLKRTCGNRILCKCKPSANKISPLKSRGVIDRSQKSPKFGYMESRGLMNFKRGSVHQSFARNLLKHRWASAHAPALLIAIGEHAAGVLGSLVEM
jgi:hypothetical protein